MKQSRYIFLWILLPILIFTLTGCSFLLSPLHGRENSEDPEAQIYNLFAYQTGEEEVTASFTWRDVFFDYDEDTAIEEAVLVYSIGIPLPVHTLPLPPDSGGMVDFTFEDDQYAYSKTVEGVSEGESVWFALYPRVKRRWLAPLYEKITVRSYPLDWEFEPSIAAEEGFRKDPADSRLERLEAGENYFLDGIIDQYAVLRFDIPKRVYVNTARLLLPFNAAPGAGEKAWAYPLTFRYVDGMDENILRRFADFENGVQFDLTAAFPSPSTADITRVIQKAILYESNAILIRMDSSEVNDINFGGEALENIEYYEY